MTKKQSQAIYKATRNYRLALKDVFWAREFGTEQDLVYCQARLTRRRDALRKARRGV
jgi:hypothetical protein